MWGRLLSAGGILVAVVWWVSASSLAKPASVSQPRADASRAKASPANPSHGVCFGGVPEVAASGVSDPKDLTIVGEGLYWGGAGLHRLDLRTMKVSDVDSAFHVGITDVGPMDARQAFSLNSHDDILSFDLKTHATRVLVPGQLSATTGFSITHPPFELDAHYLYYLRNGPPYLRGKGDGLFRVARDGSTPPELLGSPPGAGDFIVDGTFVYYRYRTPDKKLAIIRRKLAVGSTPETVVELDRPVAPVRMRIFDGRLYYVDDEAIWSVAVVGGAPPVRHAFTGSAGATDLLADGACLYWSNGRTIQRAALDVDFPASSEVIADERNYHQSAHQVTGQRSQVLASDGRYLYWPDAAGDRIMRARRDSHPLARRPELVATWIGPQPRVPVAVERIIVGDGWGCAVYPEGGAPHWQCWGGAGSAAPPPRIAAREVPWLAGDLLAAGPDRICAMVDDEARCWSAAEVLGQRPSDVTQDRLAWGNLVRLGVGGSFTCSAMADVWSCSGDDSYGQLADGEKDVQPFGHAAALGTWHGCITEGSNQAFCWGRGDGGQLGFRPPDVCRRGSDRQAVACSKSARRIPFALPEYASLVAGDMFTCAVSWKEGVSCWGASRDGLFGTAAACPPSLLKAWPTRSGPVAAPKATCSAQPVAVAGIAPPQTISIGPRGFCTTVEKHVRCGGAIPTPATDVRDVTVSPGDQASACGISGSDAVCWGAGYSPADNPSLPVHVVLDRTPVSRAAVFDEPPRSGPSPGAPSGAWDASCRIHFGCERATPPLSACAPSMKGEAWTQLAEKADALAGTKVSVRGPLTLTPVTRARGWRGVPSASMVALSVQCGPDECCNYGPRPVVIGGSDDKLVLEKLECVGDDSRTCCNAPAVGQPVIATGTLERARDGHWILRSPEVCAVANQNGP